MAKEPTVSSDFEFIQSILDKQRPKVSALPCPLCKSEQVQICMDSNNPSKDFAKCRICYCQAPLKAWNERK